MSHRPRRILCLDSSPSRLQAISRTLENSGFQVWTAADVKEAVSMAFGLRFDAVVADQGASAKSSNFWAYLREVQPSLPIVVHPASAPSSLCAPCSSREASGTCPELLLAVLTILLHTHVPALVPDATTA